MSTILRSFLIVALLTTPLFARTGDTLISDLRIMLNQSTSGNSNWTDAQLYRCLNMAQNIVAPHSGGVEDTAFLAGGSTRWSPPTDSGFIHLKGAAWLWRNGGEVKPIPYLPVDSFDARIARNDKSVTGRDNFIITEDGGQIAVFPPVHSNDSVLISFYAFPSALDSAVECEFDAGWEEVVILAAASVAYQKINSQFWVQYYTQERDKQISALRALITRRPAVTDVR